MTHEVGGKSWLQPIFFGENSWEYIGSYGIFCGYNWCSLGFIGILGNDVSPNYTDPRYVNSFSVSIGFLWGYCLESLGHRTVAAWTLRPICRWTLLASLIGTAWRSNCRRPWQRRLQCSSTWMLGHERKGAYCSPIKHGNKSREMILAIRSYVDFPCFFHEDVWVPEATRI